MVRSVRQRGRPVSRVLCPAWWRSDGHPSEAAGCPTAHAADPRAGQRALPASRLVALLFGLAPGRACRVSLRPKPASSLWRWSSPRGGRELPATSRCGARTFLTPAGCPVDARPSGRLADVVNSTRWARFARRRGSRPGLRSRGDLRRCQSAGRSSARRGTGRPAWCGRRSRRSHAPTGKGPRR